MWYYWFMMSYVRVLQVKKRNMRIDKNFKHYPLAKKTWESELLYTLKLRHFEKQSY